MRLCFVCSEYPPSPHGGIGSVTQILARGLVRKGHSVRVIGLYRNPGEQACQTDQGVEVWRMKLPGGPFLIARYQLFSKIAQWARTREIDLVEAPDWEGWSALWPSLSVPLIIRLHGSCSYFAREMGSAYDRMTFWLERDALRRCDSYCSVSQYTAARTRDLFHLRTAASAVIYNPVELRTPAPFTERSPDRVVFTGTLTAKKGVLSLIDAWPIVKRRFKQAELHIYGKDGVAESRTSMRECLVKRLPFEVVDSVFFHGHRSRVEVLDALHTARAAIFPSHAEAFAMAPLEAMAEGCPTIYSRLGSGPELIDDGETGLLINPNSPVEIAQAMMRLLENDCLSAQLGAAGYERALRAFSTQHILSQNECFYEYCMADFSARAASRN